MKYLHFTKANKEWFYTFTTNDKTKTYTPPTPENLNGWTRLADIHSKSKAIAALAIKFPNVKPIYTTSADKFTFRTPFQKKDNYRKAERNFKEQQNDTGIENIPEDFDDGEQ